MDLAIPSLAESPFKYAVIEGCRGHTYMILKPPMKPPHFSCSLIFGLFLWADRFLLGLQNKSYNLTVWLLVVIITIIFALERVRYAWTVSLWWFSRCSKILGSTRRLCYCHDQGSTVFLYTVYPAFFFCPFTSPYLVNSFKQCYLQVSAVIHPHKLADISQVALLYRVVYIPCQWPWPMIVARFTCALC